jgi:hypothetical protein
MLAASFLHSSWIRFTSNKDVMFALCIQDTATHLFVPALYILLKSKSISAREPQGGEIIFIWAARGQTPSLARSEPLFPTPIRKISPSFKSINIYLYA